MLDSSPTQLLFSFFLFFSCFFVLLLAINIYPNNCHSIKCNKQPEKYRVSSEKIVLYRTLNIWMNKLNFYHFLQFTVGKPELITTCHNDHFLNNVPTSSFYRLMVIITFQHVNRTFTFDFFKSHCLTNASINTMCRSITIF